MSSVNSAVQGLISTLGSALSGVSPFAKAVVPAAAGLVSAFVTMAFTGHFNWPSIEVLGVGVATAIVVYVVPNIEHKPAPVPAIPVAPAVSASAAEVKTAA